MEGGDAMRPTGVYIKRITTTAGNTFTQTNMLRQLMLFGFVALWMSFVVAEAPADKESAKPAVNIQPLKDGAKEGSDDLETDASSWGGYSNGWGGRGYNGGSWNYVQPSYSQYSHGGNGWNSGWGGRGYGSGWNKGYGGGWNNGNGWGWGGRSNQGWGGRSNQGWGGYNSGYWR